MQIYCYLFSVKVEKDPRNMAFSDRSAYYIGDTYDDRWGYSDFQSSDAWAQIEEENRTTPDHYNNWDAGETDWGTDW